ncbi:hypothetical protein KIN20_031379 [Parelaphostrongylus tenuis]|uniref:Uncharacterized protein n=1 Tax=Parelaphostrongylus tenuis TaxID=148309 RepID=A0AAD5R5A7_PARTN|nr:hypothetical protein KIN20_031379 [Parelaphostrongylus tenuis]
MGGSTSRPLRCIHGCWTFKSHTDDDDVSKKKRLSRSSFKSKLKKLRISEVELHRCHWEEIPTPSVCDQRDSPVCEGPPSQEKLVQIIKCFPYPASRTSSESNQTIMCKYYDEGTEQKSFGDAFEKLVQVWYRQD